MKTSLVAAAAVVLALGFSSSAFADVYRWKDSEGNIIFSDVPHPDAEKVTVEQPSIVTPYPLSSNSGQAAEETEVAEGPVPYASIEIASPANEETLRNVPAVTVSVAMSPALQVQFAHVVELLYDGASVGSPGQSTSFTLDLPDRGAHQLQAIVRDGAGKELGRSATSTFFLHRNNVNQGGGGS
ncbi:MAG: DUF4124 domain-containing protein [Pseudomonadota bacterium]